MDYNLIINGASVAVSVESSDTGVSGNTAGATVTVDGHSYEVRATRLDDSHLHLAVNGRGMNVYVARAQSITSVMVNGVLMQVTDEDSIVRTRKGKQAGMRGPETVTPPTPAVVTSVLVAPGDRVSEGQGVVVVSAMKMETTLVAPYDGVVAAVNAAAGESANPGDILVTIDRDMNDKKEGRDDDGQ
ncbi:MAG: biotin/lipoyl-containing protein [Thermodesulfobacteriota bacterium]|nr:biotin/lipoyl-containing protein [Thermodesulfobacteriota bacterium]